jgi:hypothetical protein
MEAKKSICAHTQFVAPGTSPIPDGEHGQLTESGRDFDLPLRRELAICCTNEYAHVGGTLSADNSADMILALWEVVHGHRPSVLFQDSAR